MRALLEDARATLTRAAARARLAVSEKLDDLAWERVSDSVAPEDWDAEAERWLVGRGHVVCRIDDVAVMFCGDDAQIGRVLSPETIGRERAWRSFSCRLVDFDEHRAQAKPLGVVPLVDLAEHVDHSAHVAARNLFERSAAARLADLLSEVGIMVHRRSVLHEAFRAWLRETGLDHITFEEAVAKVLEGDGDVYGRRAKTIHTEWSIWVHDEWGEGTEYGNATDAARAFVAIERGEGA